MTKHKHTARATLAVVFLLTSSACAVQTSQARWPQFRGPGGLGIAPDDQDYPAELDLTRNLLWKTAVPEGNSSPCVWGDRIFITARSDEHLETICMDRGDGAVGWRRAVTPESFEKTTSWNSHASPTPVTDGKRVYVYFGSFGVLAYGFDGKELWKKPLATPEMNHGSASSPILAEGRVIINCDQWEGPYLLALDASTGEEVWRCKRPVAQKRLSWSTPVLWRHEDETALVVVGLERLIAYDPENGRQRWCVTGLPIETAATPVYAGETLYATATASFHGDPVNPPQIPDANELFDEYDLDDDGRLASDEVPDDLAMLPRIGPHARGSIKQNLEDFDRDEDGALSKEEWEQIRRGMLRWASRFDKKDLCLAVRGGGSGDVTDTHLKWAKSEGISQVTSPLYYRGNIYLVKYGGLVTCYDGGSGEKCFREKLGARGYYCASPVAADGKVYLCADKGDIIVIRAAQKFEILARNRIGERIRATPALVDSKVYVRTAKHMMAFGGL